MRDHPSPPVQIPFWPPRTRRSAAGPLRVQMASARTRHMTRGSARCPVVARSFHHDDEDRKSTRLNSSHVAISYAVFCLKKKKKKQKEKKQNEEKNIHKYI